MNKEILVVGCGSIGERHLRCAQKTGRATITGCEPNPALQKKIRETYNVDVFPRLQEALAARKFDGIVICTPAHTHISIARAALKTGAHLLIEKPLAVKLDGIDELRQELAMAKKFCGVAYVYHLIPCVQQAREFFLQGTLGNPLQAYVVGGQHFPTYRPAYREIYYNNHETGGGAIQDALTHLVNAMEWILGPTKSLFCTAEHQSLQGVTVEDTVAVTAKNGETVVSYSMNQFQAPNETTIQIHCENGSLKIEVHEQRWAIFPRGAEKWDYRLAPVPQFDDLFIAQANAFFDGMDGKPNPLCTLDEAIHTLKFNLAALESARSGDSVSIA